MSNNSTDEGRKVGNESFGDALMLISSSLVKELQEPRQKTESTHK